MTDAISLAVGRYHARDHVNGLNVGTYLPVALPLRIFGKTEAALSLWPMASSLLGLISIAWLCRLLFGAAFGVTAALLYALHPGDVFFSTVVMPDAIQAGWLTFSMCLAASAFVRHDERTRLLLAGAGMAMGACHLVRANDVTLLPVGVAAVAICSRWWRGTTLRGAGVHVSLFLAGWACVIAAEGLAYQWAAGDFFHRLHVVNRHYGTSDSIGRMGLNVDWRTIPYSLVPLLLWWRDGSWGQLNHEQSYHALLFVWALLALPLGAAAVALKPETDTRAVAGFAIGIFWLLWPVAYHQFGSQSLTGFVPMHRLSRHLVVYAPGAIVTTMAAACLLAALSRHAGAIARAVVIVLVTAGAFAHLTFNRQGIGRAYDEYHRIKGTYSRIRARLPATVTSVAADPGDLSFFDFWMNPLGSERVRMVAFAAHPACENIQSGIVLTHSNPGWERLAAPVIKETVARLPCLLQPPAGWRLLYDGFPEKVYEVNGREREAR